MYQPTMRKSPEPVWPLTIAAMAITKVATVTR
jgi:hypothetical protein